MSLKKYRDIHLHLSGATDPVLLWEIISEAGLKSGAKDYWDFLRTHSAGAKGIHNPEQFFKIIHAVDASQSSPMAVEKCVYDSFKNSFLNHCEYLELRWNCVKRSQNGQVDLDRLVVAARAGMERARNFFGIDGGLIMCMGRDMSPEANEAVFKKALKYHHKGVLGIDNAGPEDAPIYKKHAYLEDFYRQAHRQQMITTIHTGETLRDWTEEELEYVIKKIRPQRIGHGVQIHRFPKLLKLAAEAKIHFEVCITSNLTTGVVDSPETFSKIFEAFEAHHIPFSINTDHTYMLHTNIARENRIYEALRKGEIKQAKVLLGQ
jgi:adenosine deaminase